MSRRAIVVQLAAGLAVFTCAPGRVARLSKSHDKVACDVHRIRKGCRPGDLPVRQASHFHLTPNQATAHAIALRMPHEFELRINEVFA